MDHRSVHCTLKIMVRKGVQPRRRSNFKNWRSVLDQHGNPAVYQHCIRRLLTLNRVSSAASLEKIWTTAASRHGCSSRHRLCFVPSEPLQCLRSRWGREKKTRDPHLRKELNLQIRTPQLRPWSRFWRLLEDGGKYNFSCPEVFRIDVVRPHENDFAFMLAKNFFKGPCEMPIPA